MGVPCYTSAMPRRKDELRYQLPLEFGRSPESSEPEGGYQLTPSVLAEFLRLQEGTRFVRAVKEKPAIRTASDAAQHLMTHVYTPFDAFVQEELWVLLLNTKNRITHEVMVYRGTVDTIYIRQAELVREAILFNSPGIILSHCHPSGDPIPSTEDIRLTEHIRLFAAQLGITLLDHLVIGDGVWVSLKERGLGF